jgi:hypothetical protein
MPHREFCFREHDYDFHFVSGLTAQTIPDYLEINFARTPSHSYIGIKADLCHVLSYAVSYTINGITFNYWVDEE